VTNALQLSEGFSWFAFPDSMEDETVELPAAGEVVSDVPVGSQAASITRQMANNAGFTPNPNNCIKKSGLFHAMHQFVDQRCSYQVGDPEAKADPEQHHVNLGILGNTGAGCHAVTTAAS